ncbi:MAG: hypothetical protein R2830_13190 [Saprospiraceae bacterium]
MSIKQNLATSLGRRDEAPNQELAAAIAQSKDKAAVAELVQLLQGKDKNYQADAIKTLYEIGYLEPLLIADHTSVFLDIFKGKNNRLIWGAMTALDEIARVNPAEIFQHLPLILKAADEGSVITRDHAVGILIKLSGHEQFGETAFPLLLEQMLKCPPNQFPMYAEQAAGVVSPEKKKAFEDVIKLRMEDLPKESQRKRVEKVLKKMLR